MPLLLNYTDNPETDNEYVLPLSDLEKSIALTPKGTLAFAIDLAEKESKDTVSFILPDWDVSSTPEILGEAFRSTDWSKHPTHVITLVCNTPEMYQAVNKYFQGSWHL